MKATLYKIFDSRNGNEYYTIATYDNECINNFIKSLGRPAISSKITRGIYTIKFEDQDYFTVFIKLVDKFI
jgi:5-hydroxyisourate hydrolase-like protein (transthyretin family)